MWEVKQVQFGDDFIKQIQGGWEPFAVTCLGNPVYALIWLRKRKVSK